MSLQPEELPARHRGLRATKAPGPATRGNAAGGVPEPCAVSVG